MSLQDLTRPKGPWLHLFVAKPADACDALWGLERQTPRLAARVVRGPKARTVAAFFDETSAALQFPFYFGENWEAFNDCLGDLSWLGAGSVILFFADAVHLLEKASDSEVQSFVMVLNQAVETWNRPEAPKKPRPFHIVWHATQKEEAALRKRWQAVGLSLNRLALNEGAKKA